MNFTAEVITPNPETRLISVEGEIDVYTSTLLKEKLSNSVDEHVKFVVIDLAKVEYLDSTGLGLLIGILKRQRERDGNLIIIAPSPRISRIFSITGLDKTFSIYANKELAAEEEGIQL